MQYNRLIGIDYDFSPIVEKQKISKGRVWQPFVSASYSTLDYIGVGGGLFYHNLGFEYQYFKGFNNRENGHSFGLKYRF